MFPLLDPPQAEKVSLQHADMSPATKMAALNKFRGGNNSGLMKQQSSSRVLVAFDVQVKSPDVFQVPLIINYGSYSPICSFYVQANKLSDLPKQVEDYAHR